MRIKLTEAQIHKLPLNESVADSPLIKMYYRDVEVAKQSLNSIYGSITSYSIHDAISGGIDYGRYSDAASQITEKIDNAYSVINNKLESVSEDEYDKLGYGDIESDMHSAKFDVYYKADLIMDICGNINIYLNNFMDKAQQYFGDIDTIDV